MPLFSVIVPVYNAELTIDRCIKSILEQSTDDFEFILVDDGSEDASLSICEKYSRQDPRIIVYSQRNSGVSSARNKGIELSSGDYLVFVDSDDYIEINYLRNFITDNMPDMIIGGYKLDDADGNELNIISYATESLTAKKDKYALYKSFIEGKFNTVWGKAFKRVFLSDGDVFFNDEIDMGEDTLFVVKFLKRTSSIMIIDNSAYHYVNQTKGSITSKITETVLIDKLEAAYTMIFQELSDIFNKECAKKGVSMRLGQIYKSIFNTSVAQYVDKKNVIKHLYKQTWFRNSLDYVDKLYGDENYKYRAILKTKNYIILDLYVKYKMLLK